MPCFSVQPRFQSKLLLMVIFYLIVNLVHAGDMFNDDIQTESRAVWVTRYEYSAASDIRDIIQKARQANLNIIIFQIRGQADAYYQSSFEPWAERLGGHNPGFDPLEVAIEEAHLNGLELHVWLNVFPIWSGNSPPDSPMHIYRTHPEWVMVNQNGTPMDPSNRGYAFGSPGIPAYIDHLSNVFLEVVEKYDIDGLHMDYIRFPNNNYSYDSTSVARFEQDTGYSSPYQNPSAWTQWRRDQVSNFVYLIYDAIMDRKPWVKVSAAIWGNYYDGFTNKLQDPRVWLMNQKIDFVAPMIYTADMGIYQSRINNHARSTWGRHVYGGIGANGLANYLFSPDEVEQQVQICRDVLAQGSVIFSSSSLTTEMINALSTGVYDEWIQPAEMDWKTLPVIAHTPLTDTEDTENPYEIEATIRSEVPLVSDSLLLFWGFNGQENDFFPELLIHQSDSTYRTHIPPQQQQQIYYYLLARNEEGYISRLPRWAPTKLFSFYAGPDQVPPTIVYEQNIYNNLFSIDTLHVELNVSDNIAVDTSSVMLHYFSNMMSEDSVQLSLISDQQFSGFITPSTQLNDTLHYYFTAVDLSSQRNQAVSELYKIAIGVENFEHQLMGWSFEDGWQTTDNEAAFGTYSLKFTPPSGLSADSFLVFQSRDMLDLSQLQSASVQFMSRYFLEEGLVHGYVDVSTDSGKTWAQIGTEFSGFQVNWDEFQFSLTQFCGENKPPVMLRLRAQAILDPGQEQIEWFVDDLKINAFDTPVIFTDKFEPVQKDYRLEQNYPNPFNANTVIEYAISSQTSEPVDLSIFNSVGQRVKQLVNQRQSEGVYQRIWDGRNEQGHAVPSGIYFYQLVTGQFKSVKKMMLIR